MYTAAQLADSGAAGDYLFHATGSGGTLAGLVAGKKLLGSSLQIVSVAVGEKGADYLPKLLTLSSGTLANLGLSVPVTAADIDVDHDFYPPGYEIPNAAATAAIRLLAETEGILLDPVYTGKAFAGLLRHIADGRIRRGSRVVFLHSGGTPALFAEKAIVGEIG
ncbi:1-aminocyclopropane-1-carboxylate deaminase/D-cysteine desulfhydrase [Acetonema longum]|uniref:D-cysteine desulfhydrase n=1 Tax=Acetonema longum DSM 6540 TaxID=1009370 RepID=F7NJ82_9FIRM|nr:pyridoxal-phosphate dependent enzyme [Acetonema longum]EGO63830.1 D-cysteine desulfhydrase [Acetonema longum DSM 6540]